MVLIETSKDSLVNAKKIALLDIEMNRDSSVLTAYQEICMLENRNPDFFSATGEMFDMYMLQPTPSSEYWEIDVFATALGLEAFTRATEQYGSRVQERIMDCNISSERLFRGDERNLRAETGFMRTFRNQYRKNRVHGFARTMVETPHSMEMVDRVFNDITDLLMEIGEVQHKYVQSGMPLFNGGFLDFIVERSRIG
tara:strand:- start:2644 stop:3234 length:591 start_codon:yes stop_codon:yes gene_type:complete